MQWYKATLDSQQLAQQLQLRIAAEFHTVASQNGSPDAVALFGRPVATQTGLEEELFFTPAAAALAPELLTRLRATSCDAPRDTPGRSPLEVLSLLDGTQKAWSLVR